MAGRQFHPLIRYLHGIVRPRVPAELTDAQLLERFVQQRDETAFEVLVWRHGLMVHNVCWRVLRREHAAEDAFQATFLALVRKAAAIGKRESVGSWLYKVAYHVALRARTAVPVVSLPDEPLGDPSAADPAADLLNRELAAVFDEEVNRLSDKYRVAFVLCQLEGQTIEAAARVLGCPPGTVGTRLARAREMLRRQLTRRGLDPSVPIAARTVLAALPAALVASTVQAALLRTADEAVAAGVISAHVADLTRGVLRTMFLTRWTRAAALIVGMILFGGVAVLTYRVHAVEPAQEFTQQVAQAKALKREEPDVVLQWKLTKDRPFYQEVTTETIQTTKVMGMHIEQKQEQTFHFRWTPVEKDGDQWELQQRIEGVKFSTDIGGNRITFDSSGGKNPDSPLAEFYKSLVGSEFKVTLKEDNTVQKIEGRQALLRKLAAASPEQEKLLSRILSEDAVRLLAETPFAALPKQRVRPGGSWSGKRKLDLGQAGAYQATYQYTYDGQVDNLDRIRIKVESILNRQPPAERDAAADLKFKQGELKCREGTGTLLFDRAKGRTVCLELNLKLEGKLTFLSGDQEVQVEISQIEKTRVKTTETDPAQRTRFSDEEKDREIERLREENQRLKRQLQAVEEALRGERKPKE